MSDRNLTVHQLSKELKDVEADWYMFGIRLRVPVRVLRKFEADKKPSDRCMTDMLYHWLNNTLEPTWNHVVEALEQIDRAVLADQIKRKFVDVAPTGQDKQTGVDHPKLNILVCGRAAIGKSSLVNSLFGRKVCKVSHPGLVDEDSLGGCTKFIMENRLKLGNGIQISIYDSPGLQNGTNDEEAYLDDMYSKCKDVDLVLYCVDMTADPRFQKEEARAIDMITRKFGPAIWMRCVLVLTKANCVLVPEQYAKTPALYHENLFRNKRSKFLSVLRDSIGDKTLVSFPVVAAGHHQSNEDEQWRDRYIYFASEKSKSNDPQSGGNSDGVDFISELWVTCLQTIPESSRVTFLKATASNGRLQQDSGEPTRILKMIMEAAS